MTKAETEEWELQVKGAVVGAILGPVLLYIAGQIFRDPNHAYQWMDYFWSIPAGAVTGYLMPNAWPDRKDGDE